MMLFKLCVTAVESFANQSSFKYPHGHFGLFYTAENEIIFIGFKSPNFEGFVFTQSVFCSPSSKASVKCGSLCDVRGRRC